MALQQRSVRTAASSVITMAESGLYMVNQISDLSDCALGSAMQKINLTAYLAYKAVKQNQILATL